MNPHPSHAVTLVTLIVGLVLAGLVSLALVVLAIALT
jgi:hypothetical protein